MIITPDSFNSTLLPALVSIQPTSETEGLPDPLCAMQQRYALIRLPGGIYVFDRQALATVTDKGVARKFEPLKRADATLLIIRDITNLFPASNARQIAKDFFVHPGTKCFDGIDFNPIKSSDNRQNLWVGPTVVPRDGKPKLIREFLLYVICGGNRAYFLYLLGYLAHALQRPWEKPGIMIILLSGQGTGKGALAYILNKIWSATYLHVHQIKAITGEFNSALERAFIVWLDEAFFAGNRGATDSLKSLVTEPVININEKYQPARQTQSFHRFFGASNAEHYKDTDHDDRRDFVLRVSEDRKGDFDYWSALYREIDNGGVEALVKILLAKDLSKFNVRNKPNTDELTQQKLKSLEPTAQWWYDCLGCGEIDPGMGWPKFVSTNDAIAAVSNASGQKGGHKPSALELVQTIKKLCPSADSAQPLIGKIRKRGLSLPTLKQARHEFESYMGGPIKW